MKRKWSREWKMLLIRTKEKSALGKSKRMMCRRSIKDPRNIAIRTNFRDLTWCLNATSGSSLTLMACCALKQSARWMGRFIIHAGDVGDSEILTD